MTACARASSAWTTCGVSPFVDAILADASADNPGGDEGRLIHEDRPPHDQAPWSRT